MVSQFQLPPGLPAGGARQVKVLSLTGGGWRGLFSAQLLARLEAALDPAAAPGQAQPIGARFDLIVGSSVGGILACLLSCGVPASALSQLLQQHGAAVFPPLRLRRLRKLLGTAPYAPQALRTAIDAALAPGHSSRPLAGHAPPLLLTAVDWTGARLQLLGSAGSHQPDQLGLSLMDAMLATAAAPAHFPPHRCAGRVFLDGGLAANAPDLLALQCAQTLWPGASVRLLSVGTANPLGGRNPAALPRRGLGWVRPVVELCMHAQEQQAVEHCSRLLGPQHYLRLDAQPSAAQAAQIDFDHAGDASRQILLALADDLAAIWTAAPQRARLMAML